MANPKVPDAGASAEKWAGRISGSQQEYTRGIQGTNDWQAKTAASEALYEQGVQAAIANKKFGKGVSSTSNGEWQQKTVAKASNWSTGASASKNDMRAALQKTFSIIAGVNMPERQPRGSDANWDRSKAVGKALHEASKAGNL